MNRQWFVGCCLIVLLLGGCGGAEEDRPAVEITNRPSVEVPESPLIGTTIESLPDTGLIDQHGESVSFEELSDKPVLLSFIFTRCPMQSMCPRVTRNMAQLQQEVNKQGKRPAQFVLVTFDPEYDRPDVLRQYADRYDVNHENFFLWTGPLKTIDALTKEVNIMVKRSEDGIETHNMKTYLTDREGIIRHRFRSSDWSVREVQGPLMELIAAGSG